MQPAERRADALRVRVNRPVEILDPETGFILSGYTKNLSDGGMLARFDTPPAPGQRVTLCLTLVDGRDPVEKTARVVWRADDLYGEAGDVGLRFVEPGEPDPGSPVSALCPGRLVTVTSGGRAIDAVVESVLEDSTDGASTVRVTLRVEGDSRSRLRSLPLPDADAEGELLEGEEDWTPHPVRDAWRRAWRYVGPVALVLLGVWRSAWARLSPRLVRLWLRVPEKHRARVERIAARAAIPDRIRTGLAVARRLALAIRARVLDLHARGRDRSRPAA